MAPIDITFNSFECKRNSGFNVITFLPCLRDSISCAFTHHFADVDRAIDSVAKGDGAENSLRLQLRNKQPIKSRQLTHHSQSE